MKKISFQNKTLIIDGKEFELQHRVKNARLINDLAIVIYDFDENISSHRQFQNCKSFDRNGKMVWTAEHPTNATADSYVDFMSNTDNRIWNFACFVCELDFSDGRLKRAEFTK